MRERSQFVLWGSAGHAKVLADVIASHDGSVLALFDNDVSRPSCLPGVPIYHGEAGLEQWLGSRPPGEIFAAVAIGGARGEDRRRIALHLLERGFSLPVLLHPTAAVSPSAKIGRGSQVLARAVLAADALLGEACIVNNSASVDHECAIGHGVHVAPGATLCGCVEVGDHAMIGAGAVVLPRIAIGRHAVVGAGAVVTKNVPEFHIVAGNPARTIRRIH